MSWADAVGVSLPFSGLANLKDSGATERQGRRLEMILELPCTLWGRRWLVSKGNLQNDHDVMVGGDRNLVFIQSVSIDR
jgi:hypothetical protein